MMKITSIRLTQEQQRKFTLLGTGAWLRRLLGMTTPSGRPSTPVIRAAYEKWAAETDDDSAWAAYHAAVRDLLGRLS
jgi:hypothetical protein